MNGYWKPVKLLIAVSKRRTAKGISIKGGRWGDNVDIGSVERE